jgi:hypothetical protein
MREVVSSGTGPEMGKGKIVCLTVHKLPADAGLVRKWIEQDLKRTPELRSRADAIEQFVVVADEHVAVETYAQDMASLYQRLAYTHQWRPVGRLHIFEILSVGRAYIAYPT